MTTARRKLSFLPALLYLALLFGLPGVPSFALAQSNPWTVYETIPTFTSGNSHVLWVKSGTTDTSGHYSGDTASIWTVDVNGNEMAISPTYGPYPGWHAYTLTPTFDGTLRMAWTQNTGTGADGFSSILSLWTLDGTGNRVAVSPTYGPYTGWQFFEDFTNPDGTTALFWAKSKSDTGAALDGSQISIWTVDSVGSRLSISPTYGPYSGWYFYGALPSFNKDGTWFLSWVTQGTYDNNNNYSGDQLSLWKTDGRGNRTSVSPTYGPYSGWQFNELYPAFDGTARLLWTQPGAASTGVGTQSGDSVSVWSVDRFGTRTAVSPTYGPYPGWTIDSIVAAPSSTSRLLWVTPGTTNSSGNFSGDQASIWSLDAANVRTSISPTYTAPGGSLTGLFVRPDGSENLSWEFGSNAGSSFNSTQFSLWDLDASNNRTVTGPIYGPYF